MIADAKQQLENPAAALIASALPMPVIVVGPQQQIVFVNPAAEQFFDMGAGLLLKQKLSDLIPFGSPLFQLIGQALERRASVGERVVDLSTPRHGERIADLIVTPLPEPEGAEMMKRIPATMLSSLTPVLLWYYSTF